jgi:hypothetical protein
MSEPYRDAVAAVEEGAVPGATRRDVSVDFLLLTVNSCSVLADRAAHLVRDAPPYLGSSGEFRKADSHADRIGSMGVRTIVEAGRDPCTCRRPSASPTLLKQLPNLVRLTSNRLDGS